MPFTFTDPEVQANFETDIAKDTIVHLPGGKQKGAGWKGKFSTLPLVQAERWAVRPGQKLLRRKEDGKAASSNGQLAQAKKKAEENG